MYNSWSSLEFALAFQTAPTIIKRKQKKVMSLQTSKEYSTAMLLEQALNDYSWSPTKFAESIRCIHKTLQQTLVRTIAAVIKEMGSEHHSVDARNKASHELCKEILNSGILDNYTLTMI